MAVATSTVATLTTLMLSWLDDPQAGYFTAPQTLAWLNFAQRKVQKKLILAGQNQYVIPVESLTVLGQADYVLPANFLEENRLEIVVSGTGTNEVRYPILPMTIMEQDRVSHDLGQPVQYYIKKDRVTLYPTPQTPNQVLRIYYGYQVADLTQTTDIPDIPEEYMEYLALVATFNGYIKDDRVPDNLRVRLMEYEDDLKKMAAQRLKDKSRDIVMTDDWVNPVGWF